MCVDRALGGPWCYLHDDHLSKWRTRRIGGADGTIALQLCDSVFPDGMGHCMEFTNPRYTHKHIHLNIILKVIFNGIVLLYVWIKNCSCAWSHMHAFPRYLSVGTCFEAVGDIQMDKPYSGGGDSMVMICPVSEPGKRTWLANDMVRSMIYQRHSCLLRMWVHVLPATMLIMIWSILT